MQPITDPAVSAKHPSRYLGAFGMLWVTFLIVTIFTAIKTFSIGSVILPVAVIFYPLTYIFADIFTEVYGYRVTRRIVWTGFVCILLASTATYIYTLIPPSASFVKDNEAFNLVFQTSPIVALASIAAFFGGEVANSFVLAKLKISSNGSHLWMRLIGSTFVGQLTDNTIFFLGVFLAAGLYAGNELFTLVFSTVVFCTVWEIIALPITYRIIKIVKQKEGLDTYDHGTKFNPFKINE